MGGACRGRAPASTEGRATRFAHFAIVASALTERKSTAGPMASGRGCGGSVGAVARQSG
jgi:hypothetical protein